MKERIECLINDFGVSEWYSLGKDTRRLGLKLRRQPPTDSPLSYRKLLVDLDEL